jgi:hypothetical protein
VRATGSPYEGKEEDMVSEPIRWLDIEWPDARTQAWALFERGYSVDRVGPDSDGVTWLMIVALPHQLPWPERL